MNDTFLDTNVLVYAFGADERSARAQELLAAGGWVGIQNLNEFANVALNKLKMSWSELHDALRQIQVLCRLAAPIDLNLHQQALMLAERYRLHIFDALVLASALRTGCDILWSEDMQHGLVVEGRLTIRNPFRT